MMVMPANNSKMEVGFMAGRFPGKIGWLLNTDSGWREPKSWLPYAVDNGAFAAFTNHRAWDEFSFYSRLYEMSHYDHKPRWVVVPDVVCNREATLKSWDKHHQKISNYGYSLAFAVQDGMTPSDVPSNAEVIFVGGSTSWKWVNLNTWTENFPRVHLARANTERMLWLAHKAGCESCDGTGWFRGCKRQLNGLYQYLQDSTGISL